MTIPTPIAYISLMPTSFISFMVFFFGITSDAVCLDNMHMGVGPSIGVWKAY